MQLLLWTPQSEPFWHAVIIDYIASHSGTKLLLWTLYVTGSGKTLRRVKIKNFLLW